MTLRGGGQCTDLCCGLYVPTPRNARDWGRHQGADSSEIAVLFVFALSGSIAAARRLALMIGGDIPMEDEAGNLSTGMLLLVLLRVGGVGIVEILLASIRLRELVWRNGIASAMHLMSIEHLMMRRSFQHRLCVGSKRQFLLSCATYPCRINVIVQSIRRGLRDMANKQFENDQDLYSYSVIPTTTNSRSVNLAEHSYLTSHHRRRWSLQETQARIPHRGH